MIKILHTSDWHIDQLSKWGWKDSKWEVSQFTNYHLERLKLLVNKAIKEKVSFFIFAWDLFHDSLSNYKEKENIFKELINLINSLKENKIYVIFLSWNHDITRRIKEESKKNSLELLYNINYGDYLVVNDPFSKKLEYKDFIIKNQKIRFHLFPYLRNSEWKDNIKKEINKNYIEDWKNILVSHLDIYWALYNWIEIENNDLTDVNTWSPNELDEFEFDLILLWHIHNHQVLWKDKNIIYCWSPYRLSFNEEWVEKWYYLHTLKDNKIKSTFLPLENNKWKTYVYDLNDKDNSFLELLEEIKKTEWLKNSIIRIKLLNLEKSSYKYIPYKEIRDLLENKEIFYFKWYSYKEKDISKSSDKLILKDTLNKENLSQDLDPLKIFESILLKDKTNKWEIEYNLNELKEIISEITEEIK